MRRLAAALLAGLSALVAASTVIELQPQRTSRTLALDGGMSVTLTDLDPRLGAWLLLTIRDAHGRTSDWHLENADPRARRVTIEAGALRFTGADGRGNDCRPWEGHPNALEQAHGSGLAYGPLCAGRLFLRNAVRGNRTTLEATTEFLRDHVWGGEHIVGFVRRGFYRDAFVERAGAAASAPSDAGTLAGAPPPVRVRSNAARFVPATLGLDVPAAATGLSPGRWSAVHGADGVWLSALRPGDIVALPWRPDAVEADALAYLVAFDLGRFELGFALGTEHPRLGWSARVPSELRNPQLAGPDGIDSAAPLVRTGQLSPSQAARAAAVFTGGFKREHGAFRYGALAREHAGSHYGFVEQGVVFSRLQPGLSTLYALDDGTVGMKTWTETDTHRLGPRVAHARQNGVALLERGAGSGAVVGALVEEWGAGNWSGSADEQLRTLRAGACIIESEARRYLVYGWFSGARPATLAQVFLAAGCSYAMHLDMNALEHTYLAVYARDGARRVVQPLVQGMAQLDRRTAGGAFAPRFLAFPDDRDFFYLLERQP